LRLYSANGYNELVMANLLFFFDIKILIVHTMSYLIVFHLFNSMAKFNMIATGNSL